MARAPLSFIDLRVNDSGAVTDCGDGFLKKEYRLS